MGIINTRLRKATQCKFCQQEIRFSLKTPYDRDGSIHECHEYRESRRNAKIDLSEVDPELLAQYVNGMNEHAKSKKYSVRKPTYVIPAS